MGSSVVRWVYVGKISRPAGSLLIISIIVMQEYQVRNLIGMFQRFFLFFTTITIQPSVICKSCMTLYFYLLKSDKNMVTDLKTEMVINILPHFFVETRWNASELYVKSHQKLHIHIIEKLLACPVWVSLEKGECIYVYYQQYKWS